jgi:hypothetical protein
MLKYPFLKVLAFSQPGFSKAYRICWRRFVASTLNSRSSIAAIVP